MEEIARGGPKTQSSYVSGASLIIDKGKIENEICSNIMLGIAQLKEGAKHIESKKNSLSENDWKSESDASYRQYVDDFLVYMNAIIEFFEALSKKIINDVKVFEELDSYINKVIESKADISMWR